MVVLGPGVVSVGADAETGGGYCELSSVACLSVVKELAGGGCLLATFLKSATGGCCLRLGSGLMDVVVGSGCRLCFPLSVFSALPERGGIGAGRGSS